MPMNTMKLANTMIRPARITYWMYSVLISASPKYWYDSVPLTLKIKKAIGIDQKPSNNSSL